MAPKRATGAIAASLATATAVVTVLAYSVALARDDLGLGVEDQVPAWLRLAELAAVAVVVARAPPRLPSAGRRRRRRPHVGPGAL